MRSDNKHSRTGLAFKQLGLRIRIRWLWSDADPNLEIIRTRTRIRMLKESRIGLNTQNLNSSKFELSLQYLFPKVIIKFFLFTVRSGFFSSDDPDPLHPDL